MRNGVHVTGAQPNFFLLVALIGAVAAGCSRTPSATAVSAAAPSPGTAHIVERARVTMGSELRLTAWTSDETTALAAFDAVFAEFDRLDKLLSVWKEGSDVLRINAAAGDHPVPVSADTRDVLVAAHQLSDITGGTFDVTFGALSGLWKFDHDQDNQIPDPVVVERQRRLVNYRDLVVDQHAGTAFLKKKGMRVHLGGIGKGFAIDRSNEIMRSRGVTNYMIQAGGDLFVAGLRGDRPWRLAIRDPRGSKERIFATLELTNGTFSTSGDYERFFMKDGHRYHHIIDPATGNPAQNGCRSVTIVTNRATVAEGVSKGAFILGPEKGMELIERLPDVEGVIVSDKNKVLISSGLEGKVTIVAAPTDAP
jgi:thiamine biosynthesis lipoprotein